MDQPKILKSIAEQYLLERELKERQRKRQEHLRKRERKRVTKKIQEIKKTLLKEKMQQFVKSYNPSVHKTWEDYYDIDQQDDADADETTLSQEKKKREKEIEELQATLKPREKRVDYIVRAKRLEEIPLIEEAFKTLQIEERERIAAAIKKHEMDVETRDRLARMKEDKDAFLKKLNEQRGAEDKLTPFEMMLNVEREKRLVEKKKKRKEDRRLNYLREKEEEKERLKKYQKREKLERLIREKQERFEREERELEEKKKRKRQQRVQLQMMNRAAAKQREKEEKKQAKTIGNRKTLR